jgi:DNA-directed RNA polymerase specialized sigma24 family protein
MLLGATGGTPRRAERRRAVTRPRALGGIERPGRVPRLDASRRDYAAVMLGVAAADWAGWRVIWLMGVSRRRGPERDAFELFVERVRPELLQALVATYGPVDGREAAVDALSWAWEHWDRLADVEHPVRYLYRVGQSATRRFVAKPIPARLGVTLESRFPDVEPGLLPALARLSEQQRTVVLLVHGYGWRQAEVARLLGINASTVRDYLSRAIDRLREELEASDVSRRD